LPAKLSRNAEKTLALECKALQTKLEDLPRETEERVRALRSAADHIDSIQRKIADYNNSKLKALNTGKKRLNLIQDGDCDDPRKLLNWLLIGYMVRRGLLQSARTLAVSSGLTEMVDLGVFEQMHQILKALDNHDTNPALQWCQANKSRLTSIESRLEFHLRLRDLVSLILKREFVPAIYYVKKHMIPDYETEDCLLKKHLALIALIDQANTIQLPLYSEL
jgi:hypothetical protein